MICCLFVMKNIRIAITMMCKLIVKKSTSFVSIRENNPIQTKRRPFAKHAQKSIKTLANEFRKEREVKNKMHEERDVEMNK